MTLCILFQSKTKTDPIKAPTVSGIRSRKRQCPFPLTPSASSTSAPMTTVAMAAQMNADQLDMRSCTLVITKNNANNTICAKLLNE